MNFLDGVNKYTVEESLDNNLDGIRKNSENNEISEKTKEMRTWVSNNLENLKYELENEDTTYDRTFHNTLKKWSTENGRIIEKSLEEFTININKNEDIKELLGENYEYHISEIIEIKKLFKEELSVENVLSILEINPDFNFIGLGKARKKFGEELTIEKIFLILEKNPEVEFWNLNAGRYTFGEDFSLDTVLLILSKNSNFDFIDLKILKQRFGEDFTLERVLSLLDESNSIILRLFTLRSFEYNLDGSIDNIGKILRINPNFDFLGLEKVKNLYGERLNIDRVLEILQQNINFDFGELAIIGFYIKDLDEAIDFTNLYKTINPVYKVSKFSRHLANFNKLNFSKAKKVLDDFNKDPAINNYRKILEFKNLSDYSLEEKLIIARNLYFNNKEVNLINIQSEYKKYTENKEEFSKLELFKGRNIIFTAHHENLVNGGERFSKQATIKAIKKQGNIENIIHPENNQKSLKKAKKDILEALENVDYPMTFVFDGHGGPDGIYISDGDYIDGNEEVEGEEVDVKEKEGTVKISVKDIANSLIKRTQNKNNLNLDKDIMIFASCYNHTFMRKLYDILNKYNQEIKKSGPNKNYVILPITIGQSEYNQLGLSNFDSKFGNDFFEKTLDLENEGKSTTIGTVIENQYEVETFNPSIYISDDNNLQMQIGSNINSKEEGHYV